MMARRVLYVENGIGYGGAIICLRHLVRHLDPARYEAMVVTGRGGERYREIANEARWRHIPDRRFDTVGWRAALDGARWPKRVPGLRALLSQLIARADDIGNFLPFFVQFLWTALRLRPDIVHTNNEPLCNRAAVLVARLLGIPLVAHVRSNLQSLRLLRWLYTKPDRFVPVSHWVSEALTGLGVPVEKCRVVYDGIDLGGLDLSADGGAAMRARYGLAPEVFAVGLVGLLIPWKGQQLFLDAARRLKDHIPGLRMLIIGGTPEECADYERELRARTEREGLADMVLFTGNVNDMPAVYNALDVVVSASTQPEPLGTMVIECMTMGRPLIGPAHGGAAEMAEHERTALLFEPGNAQALADAILRLYRDPTLRASLGRNARDKALATFDVAAHAAAIQAIYDELLEAA